MTSEKGAAWAKWCTCLDLTDNSDKILTKWCFKRSLKWKHTYQFQKQKSVNAFIRIVFVIIILLLKKGIFHFGWMIFFFCKSKNREIHMIRLTEVINEFTTFSPADQVLFLGCWNHERTLYQCQSGSWRETRRRQGLYELCSSYYWWRRMADVGLFNSDFKAHFRGNLFSAGR